VNDGKALSIDEIIDHGTAQAKLCCHLRDGEQQGLGCQFIALLHDGYPFPLPGSEPTLQAKQSNTCIEQLYPPLPSYGVMLWPVSPVTLTEFCWSHAQQQRHHLSPLNRLMSRENTVKVSLQFGQETTIFHLMFRYICSRIAQ
jgi:hypothetical protein